MLRQAQQHPFDALLMVGHPGKLAKLAMGQWNTHSANSDSAAPFVARLASDLVQRSLAATTTVEGVLMEQLTLTERTLVAQHLAQQIQQLTADTYSASWQPCVVLINLKGEILGSAGDLHPWAARHTEVKQ